MSDLDKIARDICWASQSRGRREGRSKQKFWNGLTDDARQGWRDMASRFCRLLRALPEDTVNLAHDQKACKRA